MLIIRPVYLIFCKHSNTYERGCTLGKQTGESLFCDVPIAKRPAWHVPREISSVRMARMEDCSAKRNKKELENDWYLCAGNFSDSNGDVVVNGAVRRFAGSLKGKKCVRVWIRVNCTRNISANGWTDRAKRDRRCVKWDFELSGWNRGGRCEKKLWDMTRYFYWKR